MILAQVINLSFQISRYQPREATIVRTGNQYTATWVDGRDAGTLTLTPNGPGFDIRLDSGEVYFPWHFLLDSDVPVRAAYQFNGGPHSFSPTGIADDFGSTGIMPTNTQAVLYTNPVTTSAVNVYGETIFSHNYIPGEVVTGRIEVDTFGQPATFEVK